LRAIRLSGLGRCRVRALRSLRFGWRGGRRRGGARRRRRGTAGGWWCVLPPGDVHLHGAWPEGDGAVSLFVRLPGSVHAHGHGLPDPKVPGGGLDP
jgi:hypothetical protein